MRLVQVLTVSALLVVGVLFLLPVVVGTARHHLGERDRGGHVVILDGWDTCVAPSADACVELWVYPTLVPGWYTRAFGWSR